jgi:hypothetical protein
MNKESLEIVSEKLHLIIDDPRVPIYDKTELIINLSHFLNPDTYEENIQILEQHRIKKLKIDKKED